MTIVGGIAMVAGNLLDYHPGREHLCVIEELKEHIHSSSKPYQHIQVICLRANLPKFVHSYTGQFLLLYRAKTCTTAVTL